MITLAGNRLTIPQGETGIISFTFKDHKTHAPLALAKIGDGYKHWIKFVVVEGQASKQAKRVITKAFELDPESDILPPIFSDTDVSKDGRTITITQGDVDHLKDKEKYKLYRLQWAGTGSYSYKYKDDKEEHWYGYDNSTLEVQFVPGDSIGLSPKIYYYSIVYEVYHPNGELCVQETFLEPSEFRVIGAI